MRVEDPGGLKPDPAFEKETGSRYGSGSSLQEKETDPDPKVMINPGPDPTLENQPGSGSGSRLNLQEKETDQDPTVMKNRTDPNKSVRFRIWIRIKPRKKMRRIRIRRS